MKRALERLWGPVSISVARIKTLYANQVKLAVAKTTATHTVITLPPNSILDMLVVKNSAEFNGTLKLGNAGNPEAYVSDLQFPKTVGMHNPILIGAPIADSTAVLLDVAGCTTGAGVIWAVWRPLI